MTVVPQRHCHTVSGWGNLESQDWMRSPNQDGNIKYLFHKTSDIDMDFCLITRHRSTFQWCYPKVMISTSPVRWPKNGLNVMLEFLEYNIGVFDLIPALNLMQMERIKDLFLFSKCLRRILVLHNKRMWWQEKWMFLHLYWWWWYCVIPTYSSINLDGWCIYRSTFRSPHTSECILAWW